MPKRFYRFLRSKELAIALFVTLGAFLLVSVLVPQGANVPSAVYENWKLIHPQAGPLLERLGFTDVFRSRWALLLFALFFMNLTLCTLHRFSAILKRSRTLAAPPSEISFRNRALIQSHLPPEETLTRLSRYLGRQGYRVCTEGQGLRAVKNRLAPCASLVLHLSFLVILLGAIVSILTEFRGTVILTEGQPFRGRPQDYARIESRPSSLGSIPELRFVVEKVNPRYDERNYLVGFSVRVRPLDHRGWVEGEIRLSEPLKLGNTMILARDFGIAPLYVLRTRQGRRLDSAFVNLLVLTEGQWDNFRLARTPYRVYTKFYPDFVLRDGVPASRSREPRNPVFDLRVMRGIDVAFEGRLARGEEARFAGFTLTFPAIRYWVMLDVVRDPGRPVIFAGFVIFFLGLLWRFLLHRREVRAHLREAEGGSEILLGLWSEYYRSLCERDLSRMAAGVKKEIHDTP